MVGNEAVDQLKKFNQALADYSMSENPRLIDGILLTKFDTIDDKVSGLAWFPNDLFPFVQMLDSAIHQINHYHIYWSPKGARWARLVHSGFPALVPQKVSVWRYNKPSVDQACSVKRAVYWSRSFSRLQGH